MANGKLHINAEYAEQAAYYSLEPRQQNSKMKNNGIRYSMQFVVKNEW